MRAEVPLCHTSDSLMEYTVHDRTKTSVAVRMYDGNFSVMITAYVKKFTVFICGKVAAAHTVNADFVDRFQTAVRFDRQYLNAFVCDGVKVFSTVGFCHVRGIVDGNDFAFRHDPLFNIDIVNVNADTCTMGISADVCNIFFVLCHLNILLFSH